MGPKTPVTEGDFFRQPLREQINLKHPLVGFPPRQNTCRSNTIDEPGAMMRKRIGKIRTSIQGQSGCTVVAAGERGVGRRCT
jgi:hypothetical protein